MTTATSNPSNLVCNYSDLLDSSKVNASQLVVARSKDNDKPVMVFLKQSNDSDVKKEYKALTGTPFYDVRISSIKHYESIK